MWGVQGWGTSLLPHPPSHALGDGPVRVLPSIPGASLLPWQSRAGHWLKGSRAFALYHDLQQGWGRCQPAVNATDPEQDKNLWGSGEQGKGWGCCKSLPNTGTPSKSHPCEVFQPFSVAGRGAPLSLAPPAQGGQSPGWNLHWPPCLLLEPRWARCPGRKGGSWAGQDAVLRPAEEVVFPALKQGFQQPMVGLLRPSTAQSQPHLAWG